jgi:transposase-like protein
MLQCPYCSKTEEQVKAGLNASGSQRHRCNACQRRYTPKPKELGYDEATRQQAVKMSLDGLNQRRIARWLGVSQGSVSNWVKAEADRQPAIAQQPETPVEVAELDELFTFVGEKKRSSMS